MPHVPAFPQPIHSDGRSVYQGTYNLGDSEAQGMTLRDYIAAAALTGMFANPNTVYAAPSSQEVCAEIAYSVADAMLTARTEVGKAEEKGR